jgi:ABC-2 type transport system permease protein
MNSSKFLTLVIATTRESLRNKMEVFFNLFFPLLFLVIFGYMFTGSDDYRSRRVGYIQEDGKGFAEVLKSSGAWEPIPYKSEKQLAEDVRDGKLAFGVVAKGNHLTYLESTADMSKAGTLEMARLTIDSALEKKINGVKPVFIVRQTPVRAGKTNATQRDYVLTGILSVSLLSAGMMSVVAMFSRYRKAGVLRRMQTVPLNPVTFVVGMTFSRLVISYASILLILLCSIFVFKADFAVDWALLMVTIFCSTLGMMALGLLLTVLFRNPETANTTAGILMFLMQFLAGIFFPLSLLPGYLKVFSAILPLRYVSILLRHSLGVEIVSGESFALICIGLVGSGVLLLWITGRRFLRPE